MSAGHQLKDAINITLTHILGLGWGVAVLTLMNRPEVQEGNTLLLSFVILCVFGILSVIVTNIGIKLLSHTPSLFSGWAIGFATLGGVAVDEWQTICIDVIGALIIGIWFVGVGISQFQSFLIKLSNKGKEEGVPLEKQDKDVTQKENSNIANQIIKNKEQRVVVNYTEDKIARYTKAFNSTADMPIANKSEDKFEEITELRREIIDLKDIMANSSSKGYSSQSIDAVSVKIIGICGSPHKKGSTIEYLKEALRAAESLGNVSIELIELSGKEIKPCMGCKSDKCYGTCRINDYMQEIYPKLRECDGIILGSPSYFGTFTSQLKLLIDRLRVMRHTDFELGNKVIGTLAVAGRRHGGQEITNIDLMQSMMRHNTIIVNDGTAVCQLGATGWSHTFDDPNVKGEDDYYGMQTAVGVGKRVAEIAKVIKGSGLQRTTYEYDPKIGKR